MDILTSIKNYDKYLHLAAGLVTTVIIGLLNPILGLAVTALLARWKELYDSKHPEKHTSDGWDAYATLVGAIPGQIILNILAYYDIWHPLIPFLIEA